MTRDGSTLVLGALVLLGVGFLAGSRFAARPERATARGRAPYRCAMHPSYSSDGPGQCPVCGMALVASPDAGRTASSSSAEAPPVAGRAVVELSPERRQLLGVRSEAVRRVALDRTIRTVGRVAPDERRVHSVSCRVAGSVERVYVDVTGHPVRVGDPLLSLVSPELAAAQEEYLSAFRGLAAGEPASPESAGRALAAARQRLLDAGLAAPDVERLERAGDVRRRLEVHAEASGYVIRKTAVAGMRVAPGDPLLQIADLTRLWVLADVYEHDLPGVRPGMRADVTLPYLPLPVFKGSVSDVAPLVDERTRTVKVRIEVDNRGERLKPEMQADVLLRVALGSGLAVNESAVIDAGERRLVFLDQGQGRYEPREVTLGAKAGRFFQVLAGLEEGERVVTSANFLLDSESSLRAASAAAPR